MAEGRMAVLDMPARSDVFDVNTLILLGGFVRDVRRGYL